MNSDCKFFIQNGDVKDLSKFKSENVTSGKSLYEVIRVIEKKPLFLREHIERLENSSSKSGLKLWLTRERMKEDILRLINVNKCTTGNIKLVFNYNVENNFLLYFIKYHYPDKSQYIEGVDTTFFFGERHNPNAKIIDNDFRKRIDIRIKDKNVFEAVLVDRNGNITEGSRSNIFFIKGSSVVTAPLDQVLPGTTRRIIFDICSDMGIRVIERKIKYTEAETFDAAFISGTSPKVLPIRAMDEAIYSSSNNKFVLQIMKAYDKRMHEDINSFR